jgi:DNA-binding NarL/FixJ family response regulator
MRVTKVLLVDDNPDILDGLRELLTPEFVVVGCLNNGSDVLQQAEVLVPDVIILDVSLEDMNGFEVASELKAGRCPAKVIFLSCHEIPSFVRRALKLGAKGYVYKSQMTELADAINVALEGGVYSPVK